MARQTDRPLTRKAAPEVVAAAEALLADVVAGKIKAFAVCYVSDAAPYTGSTSAVAPRDMLSVQLLKGSIRDLDHEFMHAMRGR